MILKKPGGRKNQGELERANNQLPFTYWGGRRATRRDALPRKNVNSGTWSRNRLQRHKPLNMLFNDWERMKERLDWYEKSKETQKRMEKTARND